MESFVKNDFRTGGYAMRSRLSSDDYLESREFPFHIQRYELTPGGGVPAHAHEFIELVYVEKGSGYHDYNGSPHPIRAGDVFVIARNASHAYRVGRRLSLRVCNVLFETRLLARELSVMAEVTPFVRFFYIEPFLRQSADFQDRLTVNAAEAMDIEPLLDRLESVYKEKGLGYRIWIKALLIELFIVLSRCSARALEEPELGRDASDAETIRRICRFIEQHHEQDWTMEQITGMCGMSKTKFSVLPIFPHNPPSGKKLDFCII